MDLTVLENLSTYEKGVRTYAHECTEWDRAKVHVYISVLPSTPALRTATVKGTRHKVQYSRCAVWLEWAMNIHVYAQHTRTWIKEQSLVTTPPLAKPGFPVRYSGSRACANTNS